MTTMKFRFNTGRLYQADGQKIDVEAVTDGTTYTVKFWDRSRGIDGAFTMTDITSITEEPATEREMERAVMQHYDYNNYTGLCSFEHITRQRLPLTEDFRDWIANSVRTLATIGNKDNGHDNSSRACAREVVRHAQTLGVNVEHVARMNPSKY